MSPNHITEGRCQLWKCFKTKNNDGFLWQYLTKFCIIVMGDTNRFVGTCSDGLIIKEFE